MATPRTDRRKARPSLSEGPRFTFPLGKTLRGAGLQGAAVEVELEGKALILRGDGGGRLSIPAREVECMRIASYTARSHPTSWQTFIWRSGERRPVAISPLSHEPGDYGPMMRTFSIWVSADGGRVLRGPGLTSLIIQMILTVGSVSLVALVLLGAAIVDRQWYMWLITAFVAGLAVLLFVGLRRTNWPRRVTEPDLLAEFLPPAQETVR